MSRDKLATVLRATPIIVRLEKGFTDSDTDNVKYDAGQVWEAAGKRFITRTRTRTRTRLRAYIEHVRRKRTRNSGLGRDTSYSSFNRVLTPLAYFDPNGQCTLDGVDV